MTNPGSPNNPAPVMKFVAAFLLCATVVLTGLALVLGVELTKWHVVLISVPSVVGLVMLFDSVRNAVLSAADRLPFVKYQKPPEGGANG